MPQVINEAIRDAFKHRPDPRIPPKPTETVTIVSIFPNKAYDYHYPFGNYMLEANEVCSAHGRVPCRVCKQYVSAVIEWGREAVDSPQEADGSGRRLQLIAAKEIAESLLVDNCTDRGIFMAAGAKPTDQELEDAIDKYEDWAKREVKEADIQWGRKRDVGFISPHAFAAAKYLNETREWASDTATRVNCEACGELMAKGAFICGKCTHPADWQRAYELDLLSDRQVATGKRLGKIKEDEPEPVPAVAAEVIEADKNKGGKARHVYGS